jgi:hypothetical protein
MIIQRLARVIKPILAGSTLDSLLSSTASSSSAGEVEESFRVGSESVGGKLGGPTPKKRKVAANTSATAGKDHTGEDDEASDAESVASRAGRRRTIGKDAFTELPSAVKKPRKITSSSELAV